MDVFTASLRCSRLCSLLLFTKVMPSYPRDKCTLPQLSLLNIDATKSQHGDLITAQKHRPYSGPSLLPASWRRLPDAARCPTGFPVQAQTGSPAGSRT